MKELWRKSETSGGNISIQIGSQCIDYSVYQTDPPPTRVREVAYLSRQCCATHFVLILQLNCGIT
jgi:hypothetical protein